MTYTRENPPPITHEPHVNCVIYQHDSVNVVVALSVCDEGRCVYNDFVQRYTAAGMNAVQYPPHEDLWFWDHQDALRTMAYLKLAQHEGRQRSVDSMRARLVALATGKIQPGQAMPN